MHRIPDASFAMLPPDTTIFSGFVAGVEDFWAQHQVLANPSELLIGTTLYFFRLGHEPEWEVWPSGGAWRAEFVRSPLNETALDSAWEALLLALIGEQLCDDPAEICGCELSVKHSHTRLALWTRTASAEQVQRNIAMRARLLLGEALKDITWQYMPHTAKRRELTARKASSTMARGSTIVAEGNERGCALYCL